MDKQGRQREYVSAYLRRTYRDGDTVRNETVANLSMLPPEAVDAIEATLKGTRLLPVGEAVTITRSLPHGHVAAVAAMAHQLGLPALLGPACRSRDIVIALIVSRVIRPGSKLSTLTWWHDTTLGVDLGVTGACTDEVYAAMDWLAGRQEAIEKKLAARHLAESVNPARLRGSAILPPLFAEDTGYSSNLPIELHMRLATDSIEFCSEHMPRFHPFVEDTYYISDGSVDVVDEMALGFVELREVVRRLIARGVDVDRFAPRIALLVNCRMDFFAEIAKIRASRRLYARMMRDEFGAARPALAGDQRRRAHLGRDDDLAPDRQQHRARGDPGGRAHARGRARHGDLGVRRGDPHAVARRAHRRARHAARRGARDRRRRRRATRSAAPGTSRR